ncbi:MAG: DNA polymerase domain-containing protein [Armatimonadota bacterium]|nr:DNA polymerase domain-containing protein [Armatimonadota bacterium]MDR7518638.1 DNA polymerase domain-containing protein [Armatimonadota bacterium]MDR7549830.1 DNA polymerase domain-containing protein [Armatimonadota bacterium]
MALAGWLFDAYPSEDGMAVWLVGSDGRPHRLTVAFAPVFYAAGPPAALERLPALLAASGIEAKTAMAVRTDLLSGADVPVLQVAIRRPGAHPAAVRVAARLPRIALFTCDLSVPQVFFAQTGLFPLGRYRVEDERSVVAPEAFQPLDAPEDVEYALPPLTTLRLRLDGDPIDPTHARRTELEASVDGETVVLCSERPEDLVASLNRLIARYDPDVILTEWGDSFLVPRLRRLARQVGMPLRWNRESHQGIRTRRARSYLTYGHTVYSAGAQMLHGRWHLDLRNSFIYAETELTGLVEIARLSRLPVQSLARTSIGTAISAMQLHRAIRRGILIPHHKSEPEAFKSAEALLVTDKGGLVYQPVVGVFEGVGELDFSSMYPTIMARFNVSPETITCACCPDAPRVPETGARLCQRRKGLVPEVLEPLLERRAYYKRRKQETAGEARALYQQRQTALKWCLVCAFGYLGYRNARFGRIEAHEATTAFSREMLLRAKDLAEAQGYRMLHALVDSMWLHRPGATKADYDALAGAIERATGLPIFVEGVYDWIAFLPSRTHPGLGVPNRYLGRFDDGETKVRGIEVRRADLPPLVAHTQARMLEVLFEARTLAEVRAAIPRVLDLLAEAVVRLRDGEVRATDLAMAATISRAPEAYRGHAAVAVAARQMARAGVRLHSGERIQYLITDAGARLPEDRVRPLGLLGPDWSYDVEYYTGLLIRATETLLGPLGYPAPRLAEEVEARLSPAAPAAPPSPGRCAQPGRARGC